jgi:Domain of unknown function (DUF4062)/HEPN domain
MDRTKIFVSSTYFDLAQVREDIRTSISQMGHEPLLSEYSSFPTLPDIGTVENCKKAVQSCDLFVLIVGGRRLPNSNQSTDASAMALLNCARQFHEIAELAYSKSHSTDALYAQYFHVTELLLKAYLLAHNVNPWGHGIVELYKECRGLGLAISSEDRFGLENVVRLLQSGNENMAFRYFSLKSGSRPDLSWTREVVGQLMQVVAAFVESKKTAVPGVAVKMIMTFGKPVPKDSFSA